MAKTHTWKLWLRRNLLNKDNPEGYFAHVSTAGRTLRNEDLVRIVTEQGSEIKYETLLATVNHIDRLKREKLLSGVSILDGVAHYTPRVNGNWPGGKPHFDPELHSITLDITPSSEMHKALASKVSIEVLGIRGSGAYVGLVTDFASETPDGKIYPGSVIAIEGRKIKIEPDDDENLGIFLVPLDAAFPTVRLSSRLIRNSASKIIAHLVADTLRAGKYQLQVVTRYTGKYLLKEPRTLVYNHILTVMEKTDAPPSPL
jgi:hypothetical protein